ncbi:MAG: bifunctional diaminohydroxyphosphoribosylaminopyrimidine deaminase/5-amino-6-(5-phosphoribosylamino)uracil reductase RibD, partial [Planctomycetota bacterium]
NPMVGCVIVGGNGGGVIGEGWHERFGEAHAEVNALSAAGDAARGATAYVTLEPCCHTGKTPPCSNTLIEAGIARVVVAVRDPFPQVDGGGIAELEAADIEVVVGVGEGEARELLAPYLKLITTSRPWVIAKWAMTLDGKIATRTGSSQWISNDRSRQTVHQLRGRMDAIIIGRKTAIADDPRLTARLGDDHSPARVATRVVLGAPPRDGKLFESITEAPLLVITRNQAEADDLAWATDAGAEVIPIEADGNAARIAGLLDELGRRRMTNVLIEGGGGVLGAAFDGDDAGPLVDEVHVFIGPKLVGGQPAPSPVGGEGVNQMADALQVSSLKIDAIDGDAYLHGRLAKA